MGRPGLIGTMARTAVIAGTATAVSGNVQRRQQGRADQAAEAQAYEQMQQQAAIDQQVQASMAASQYNQPPAAAPAAPAGDPLIDKLTQLASLHTAGVLSDDEFASAKAKLLAV